MKHTRLTVIIFSLLTIFLATYGQQPESPITWRAKAKMITETEGVLTLRANLSPGWHLYGTSLPEDGPIPTTFDFSASEGIRFIDDFKPSVAPETKADPNFGLELNWWESNVTFTRNFVVTGEPDKARIVGTVRFMGCNDMNCMPPATVNFDIKVKTM